MSVASENLFSKGSLVTHTEPSSFTWAWDQQDITDKQINPGGVA